MDDDTAVSEEGANSGNKSSVLVDKGPAGRGGVDGAKLARQVTNLAGLRSALVTGNCLATLVGVQMGQGTSAVSVSGNRLVMEMVVPWASGSGQTTNLELEVHTSAAGVRGGEDRAADRVLGAVELGNVRGTGWVVGHDFGITELASCLGASKGERGEKED